MAIYDLAGHFQLDEAVTEQGAAYLEYQTLIAETTLGVGSPAFPAGLAHDLALIALVLQVNWQENTGADARMLSGSTRAGVSFRSEGNTGLLPLADPQALAVWARATAVAVAEGWEPDGEVVSGSVPLDPSAWRTLRSRRPAA